MTNKNGDDDPKDLSNASAEECEKELAKSGLSQWKIELPEAQDKIKRTKKGGIDPPSWSDDPKLRKLIADAYATRPHISAKYSNKSEYFEDMMIKHWVLREKIGDDSKRTTLDRLKRYGNDLLAQKPPLRQIPIHLNQLADFSNVVSVQPTPSTRPVRIRSQIIPRDYFDLGSARIVLFSWLFARNQGGTLILRMADQDVDSNRSELVKGALDNLRWLGIDWDEGPFYNSERLSGYVAAANFLLKQGNAYLCYCGPENNKGFGDVEHETGQRPSPGPVTRCACRDANLALAEQRKGQEATVRFRVPLHDITRFDDAVFGPRELITDQIEDFVLLYSLRDGEFATARPTPLLVDFVDDIGMGVTHVVRALDQILDTPKQLLLYRALERTPPIFCHVPMVLNADRTPLSNDHPVASVSSYRDEGFLPEAFRNFVALLGWSPGNDAEFLPTSELIARFSLNNINRANTVFDRGRLERLNQQYLLQLPIAVLVQVVRQELERSGLWRPEWGFPERAGGRSGWFARKVDLLRPEMHLLPDFSNWARAFPPSDFGYECTADEKSAKLKAEPPERPNRWFWDFVLPQLATFAGALLMQQALPTSNSGADRLLTYRLLKRL